MGRTVAFLAVAGSPLAAWIVRNLALAGSAAERPLAFHPVTLVKLGSALDTVSLWLLPARLPTVLRFAAFLAFLGGALVAAALVASRDGRPAPHTRQQLLAFLKVTFVFVVIYGAVLVLSISFLDAHTPSMTGFCRPCSLRL